MYCVNDFSDNSQKPPIWIILWPLEGQNWASVAQTRINSEHSPNNCLPLVWIGLCECFLKWWSEANILTHFQSFSAKIGPTRPKRESVLNTYPINAYSKFELNRMTTFPDNGRKPRTDSRKHGRTDERSTFLCLLPTSVYHLSSYWVLVCLRWVYIVFEHTMNSKRFQISTSWTHKKSWTHSITNLLDWCLGCTYLYLHINSNTMICTVSIHTKYGVFCSQ